MSISGQNLSIVIVTLKSENVIDQCIKSIDNNLPIIIVENSNDRKFKDYLESEYKNVKCILTNSNLGMGAGNNIGIKLAKTQYVLILNADVILEPDTLNEIFLASKNISEFSILSPISSDVNYPNYKIFNDVKKNKLSGEPFKVDYVDGFAMLFNKNKFKDDIYFDENFFLYLENNDLCLRVNRLGNSVYVIPKAKVHHGGAKTLDSKYHIEVEFSRNWHWVWSKFYFNKKNFGLFKAFRECLLIYFSALIKCFFYSITNNKYKKKIYFNRASGFYNSLLGKSSWYRPNLND